MTPRDYADYLRDILDAATKARRFENVTFDNFALNDEKVYAVMHALQIIGEGAKMIPPAARKRYPQIPWREVVGMRDKLSHGYFSVDVRRLWQTVQDDLPPLQVVVEQMLSDLGSKKPEWSVGFPGRVSKSCPNAPHDAHSSGSGGNITWAAHPTKVLRRLCTRRGLARTDCRAR